MVNYYDKYLRLWFFYYMVSWLLIVSSVRADDGNDLNLQATSNTPQDASLVTDTTDSTLNINICNGEKCTNSQAFSTEESSTVSYIGNDNSLENESSTMSASSVAVTELTTVNTSDGVSVNTTTHKVLVNVSTTSSPVTTTTSGDKKFKSSADAGLHYCDCDIMRNECDINCCCDKDCSEQDRLVFTYCLPPDASTPLPSQYSDIDNRHCYTSHFIYLNNTKMLDIVEHAAPGLFCIAINNLPAEVMYKYYPLIKSVNQFNKVLKRFRKKFYFWPQTPVNESLCDTATDYGSSGGKSVIALNSTEYKFGDYIQYFTNGSTSLTKKYLSVPVKIPSLSPTSSMCNGDTPIQYLKDYSGNCLRKSPDTKDDCESILKYIDMYHYYNRDLKVLAVPHLVNSSAFSYSDCPEDICIGVVPSVCVDDNFEVCYDNVILRPTFNIISDVCMNAVDKLQYVVYHNGSQGIIKIDINFHLTNISLVNKHQMFRQHFQVRYSQVINNVTFTTAVPNKKPLTRSGTPGYLPGKPIISGRKIVNIDMDMNEHMEMNDDPNYWLTIPKTKMNGHCDENKNHRLNVVFLQNIKSECILLMPSSCDTARNKSREILLGENAINLTDVREANIYVSSFGDPNLKDFNSWVPVLIDVKANPATGRFSDVKNRQNKCPNSFTNINYKILFSYTSVVKRPQAKIIGVLMSLSSSSFSTEQSLNNKQNESLKLVKITSTVTFVDVTRPEDVIVRFADPPVYEIKLPPDFFYPFLSNSNRISTSFVSVWLYCLCNFYAYI